MVSRLMLARSFAFDTTLSAVIVIPAQAGIQM
jgi:hypothetical protein